MLLDTTTTRGISDFFLFRYLLGPKAVTFTILRHPIQVFESLYAYADFNAILKLDIHEYIKL